MAHDIQWKSTTFIQVEIPQQLLDGLSQAYSHGLQETNNKTSLAGQNCPICPIFWFLNEIP